MRLPITCNANAAAAVHLPGVHPLHPRTAGQYSVPASVNVSISSQQVLYARFVAWLQNGSIPNTQEQTYAKTVIQNFTQSTATSNTCAQRPNRLLAVVLPDR